MSNSQLEATASATHRPALAPLPREGMVANIRNRRAVITQVTPFDGPNGRLHLIAVDYADLELPTSESLLWEREVGATLSPPKALPDVSGRPAMQPVLFDAIVRAARWQALTPFVAPDGLATAPRLPIASPFHGAVQVEDYQLEPLLRALQMPRVSLLLADDVGLGKTIEAGLILSELLLRRRVRRVLILTPGSLRDQWQEEMRDKFALHFDLVDRDATWQLRRRIGVDANPWRTYPRIVASYHYLRQPDVLEQLLATCREHPDHARLPWDLLIVDEAHNLMPGPFGQDSDLVEMLRQLSPYFEHKLFLTATPHNGHTESFTGLLELLDPVRFSKSDELPPSAKKRLEDVLVRRLKREISAHDAQAGRVPRFGRRDVSAVSVAFTAPERALSQAFRRFKQAFTQELARRPKKGQLAGRFALNAFEKRLLSCPVAFADSWYRLLEGLEDPATPEASDHELDAANQSTLDDQADDTERASRERTVSRIIGAWLRPLARGLFLPPAIEAITAALIKLGLTAEAAHATPPTRSPQADGRFDALRALIEEHLRHGGTWRKDERLIVFTEYKTTLDYLVARLRRDFNADAAVIAELYGGMDKSQRLAVRVAFNDPEAPVRVLVATDAASEGLNLQETARHLLHFDVPWNPSRLEQRNGRLDRHGQARDVTVFHFTSEDDDDLAFLGKVVAKVDRIREDLGAVGEVFDEAFARRFDDGAPADEVQRDLDLLIAERQADAALPTTAPATVDMAEIDALHAELDLSPDTLARTLRIALLRDQGTLAGPNAEHLYRLGDIPPRWAPVIDDHLRLPTATRVAGLGPLPNLAFDPQVFVEQVGGRPVFRPKRATRLLHLAHPVYRQTLTALSRLRFDTATDDSLSRWTVRRAPLPPGLTALVVVSLEELVVNALREPFHYWVRTLHLPVRGTTLGSPLAHIPPATDLTGLSETAPTPADVATAKQLWEDLEDDLKDTLQAHARRLDDLIRGGLERGLTASLTAAREAMRARKDEVTSGLRGITPKKIAAARRRDLERDIRRAERTQPDLFGAVTPTSRLADLRAALQSLEADARAEADRRQARYRENLETLAKEERRVIDHLLPQRFALASSAADQAVQLYPIAVELRLPLRGRA